MPKKSLKHLPEAEWPPADRDLFATAFRADCDLFDGRGPGSHLRLRTVAAIHYGYRRWLGWQTAFHPNALALPAADRITPKRVQRYVSHLRLTQNSVSVAIGVGLLYAAARYTCPERDWSWLKGIKRRLEAIAVPYPPKAIPFTSQRLVDLGLGLMTEAEETALHEKVAHGRIRLPTALQFRDGLLIAVVGLTTLRRSNLESLSLGTTLRRTGDTWMIEIDGEDTKNGDPYMAALPDWLAERLETYLEHFRPVFFGARRHSGLWATRRGRPACGQALYEAFTTRILDLTGHHVTLHDVRRIGCTTWAIADPETAGGARELLGDRDYRVIEKHYNRARGIEASRKHNQNLVALRRKLGQSFEVDQKGSLRPVSQQDRKRRS